MPLAAPLPGRFTSSPCTLMAENYDLVAAARPHVGIMKPNVGRQLAARGFRWLERVGFWSVRQGQRSSVPRSSVRSRPTSPMHIAKRTAVLPPCGETANRGNVHEKNRSSWRLKKSNCDYKLFPVCFTCRSLKQCCDIDETTINGTQARVCLWAVQSVSTHRSRLQSQGR